jgi:hypothetical protein
VDRLRLLLSTEILGYGGALFQGEAALVELFERVATTRGCLVDNLLTGLEPGQARRTLRALAWMHKAGLVKSLKI